MFALVADVERYPEFVPLCQALRVRSRETSAEGDAVLLADMEVGYQGFHETFTSRVTLRQDELLITAQYVDGPFSHMDNHWTFRAIPDGCEVEFHISYELRSLMLRMLVGAVFERAFRRFAEAFETRAHQVYGEPSGSTLSPV